MSFPPVHLKQPSEGCRYLWGGRYVQAFTLAVLPAGSAQVPFLAKNYTVQGWEDRPHHDGASALPVPKGQGGQVQVVTHPHPRIPPRVGGFYFCGGGAATTTATAATPSTSGLRDEVSESHWGYWTNVLSSLHICQYWLKQEGELTPWGV